MTQSMYPKQENKSLQVFQKADFAQLLFLKLVYRGTYIEYPETIIVEITPPPISVALLWTRASFSISSFNSGAQYCT